MNNAGKAACCVFGITVNDLIDAVEELIEDVFTGEGDLIEKDLNSTMRAIKRVRESERNFKIALGKEMDD